MKKQTKKKQLIRVLCFGVFLIFLSLILNDFQIKIGKNQNMVHFPRENLDLTKYVVGYNKDSYKYDLYGICNHTGSVQGGHYFAYVKVNDNDWYEFNETTM